MVKAENLLDKIRETKAQIENTNSKQRKYELHRHLNKLQKQLKANLRESRR